MKHFSTTFGFLLFSLILSAQNPQNAIKLGFGFGQTAYESVWARGFDLQYDRQIGDRFTVTITGAAFSGQYSNSGRSQGSNGTGTWDNSWKISMDEDVRSADLGLLYSFFGNEKRNNLKIGAGISFTKALFEYPKDVFIKRGIIERQVIGQHEATTSMFNVILDNDFNITSHVTIGIRGIFRTTLEQKYPLQRIIKDEFGFSSTSSGILNIPSLMLKAGYRF